VHVCLHVCDGPSTPSLSYDDDEDEIVAEAASRGLQGEERDEWVLRQLDKEVVYEFEVSPIVVMELEEDAKARGLTLADVTGGALGSRESTGTSNLALLSLPEQIELQETIKKLHKELSAAKKKNAQEAALANATSNAPKALKKKKNKIGGGGHVERSGRGGNRGGDDDDGDDEGALGGGFKSTISPKSKAVRKSLAIAGGGSGGANRKSMAWADDVGGDAQGSSGFKEKRTMRQSILESGRGRAPTLSHNIGFDDVGHGGYGGGYQNQGMDDDDVGYGMDKRKSMLPTFHNPMAALRGGGGGGGAARKEVRKSRFAPAPGAGFAALDEGPEGIEGTRQRTASRVGFSDGAGGGEAPPAAVPSGGALKGGLKMPRASALRSAGFRDSESDEFVGPPPASITGCGASIGGAGVVPKKSTAPASSLLGRVEASKSRKTEKKAAKMAVAEFEKEDML
jgi:hypothetical protein